MLFGKKIVVVLPAYQAERTLRQTFSEIPREFVDEVILVDDASTDKTAAIARSIGVRVVVHERNMGYGANQKTCYKEALNLGADIVVMLHPDYQYDPKLVVSLASMIASDVYDVAIGSRILGNTTKAGGMPRYKYYSNRILTLIQNVMLGTKLSEYHTGYRAFSREVLLNLPIQHNSDDFIFDNEVLTQVIAHNYKIGEISCPTKYFPEASSINLYDSIVYGFGVIKNSCLFRLWKIGLINPELFLDRKNESLGVVTAAKNSTQK